MATYAQTPGLLNIKAVTGTDFSCQLDFDSSLVGYTFDAAIVLQEYPTKREQAITVTVDNAAQGIVTLSLTDTQTSALGTLSKKKWYLNWNISGIKQTILAGNFELSDIPLGQNEVTSTGVTINTQSVDITLSAFSNAALEGKQPLNEALTQISGLSPDNDDFLQRKAGAWTNRSIAQVKTDLAINNVDNTSDANKPVSTATQTALDLKLDTSTASSTYQPLDTDLTSIAGLSPSDNDIIQRKSGAWTNRSIAEYKTDLGISAFGGNLIDDADASAARTTLGLGSIATQNSNNVSITGGSVSGITDLALADGGTNNSLTASSGGVVYSTATQLAISGVGTSGQYLRSNGSAPPTWEPISAVAGAATIFNDETTNREYYPVFAYQSAGTAAFLYGSTNKLKFNPSSGYFTADGGFVVGNGDLHLRDSGIYWAGGLVFSAEENAIFPAGFSTAVADWNAADGMRINGSASKDVPLRLWGSSVEPLSTGSYIIVRPSASATTNGTELRNAYAAAKTFTPNSLPLSATNRATVLLLPGQYSLGTTPLTMDTEFVDLVGISEEPRHVFITSQVSVSDSGTIVQTADNVVIRNVSINRTTSPSGSGAGRSAAYFPNRASTSINSWTSDGTLATVASNGHGLQTGDSVRITGSGNSSFDGVYTITRIDNNSFTFPSTVNSSGIVGAVTERFDDTYIENCQFSGDNDSSMRRSVEYSGTYKNCNSASNGFGFENGGRASGYFEKCSTGSGFGYEAEASGTFIDCSAAAGFGSTNNAVASGTFIRCVATAHSFGSSGGGNPTFATGIFNDCTMTNPASYNGTFTGTMHRCRFVCTGTNQSALRVGDGAKIFDSTLIATGTGNSITASSPVTISLAGCRMNRDVNANVSNNLGTLTESYNLVDSDIT